MKTALALQLVMTATDSALPRARRNRKRKQRWPVACSCCVQGGGKLAFAVSQHSPAQKKLLLCLGEVLRRRRHCGPTCASKVAGRRSGVQGPKFLRSHTHVGTRKPLQRPLGCEIAPGRLLGTHPSLTARSTADLQPHVLDVVPQTLVCQWSSRGVPAIERCQHTAPLASHSSLHTLHSKSSMLVCQERAQWECKNLTLLEHRLMIITFTLQPYTKHCVPSVPSQLRASYLWPAVSWQSQTTLLMPWPHRLPACPLHQTPPPSRRTRVMYSSGTWGCTLRRPAQLGCSHVWPSAAESLNPDPGAERHTAGGPRA